MPPPNGFFVELLTESETAVISIISVIVRNSFSLGERAYRAHTESY